MRTLSVVGGGVIGLSVAWRAATAGWRVRLHDPNPGRCASWVAGGMLAPLTEGPPGDDAALRLGFRSLELWPAFAADLETFTTGPSGLRSEGTLAVGVDQADLDQLSTLAGRLTERGRSVTTPHWERTPRARTVAGQHHQWRPRCPGRSCGGQSRIARSARPGLHHRRRDRRSALGREHRGPAGRPGRRRGGSVVSRPISRRRRSARSRGRSSGCGAGLMPFRAPTRTVRALIHGRHVYVVPRENGVVVGATQLDAGFDDEVTLGRRPRPDRGCRGGHAWPRRLRADRGERGTAADDAGRPAADRPGRCPDRVGDRSRPQRDPARADHRRRRARRTRQVIRLADLVCADPGRFR